MDAERQRKKEARTDARAARRRANPDSSNKSDSDSDSDDDSADDEDDEFRQGDANAKDFQKRIARQGGVGGAQMKTTVPAAERERAAVPSRRRRGRRRG